MIVDSELDFNGLYELMNGSIRDQLHTYFFSHIETIPAPITDDVGHRTTSSNFLRITFV